MFLRLIKNKNIDVVVDVRRFPTSRFEDFKKERLTQILMKNGIDYFHFGNELGGYRKGGYENYMKTKKFEEGFKKLLSMVSNKNVCIICAETFPWKCHRRFIAQKLIEHGYEVIHLIDEKRTWQQDPKNKKNREND